MDGKGGCYSGQCLQGTNRWRSVSLPATLTMSWTEEEAFELGTVQLILDTGLHRQCTFSIQTETESVENWGSPQPEVLQDYSIEVQPAGSGSSGADSGSRPSGGSDGTDGWVEVLQVTGNH